MVDGCEECVGVVGRDFVFGDLVVSVGVMVVIFSAMVVFVGVTVIVIIERDGGWDNGRGEVLVSRCLVGGGVVVRDFRSGDMVFFIGLMLVFVRMEFFFGAERGGGRGVRRGGIYYVVVIILIVDVMVMEGWTSIVERNGFAEMIVMIFI